MEIFDKVSFDEWQEVADKCGYATFFHTPIWSRIFARTYPEMEIATKKFVLADKTKIILPLIKMKALKSLFKSYVSNIAGVYGGIISERKIQENEIKKIFAYLIKVSVANISVTGNPLFDYNLPQQFKMKKDFTQVIELGRDEKEIWSNYTSACRRQINKARREEIICKEASDFNQWKQYYSIYQETLKRWGNEATSNYPFSLFENLFKARDPNIKLWLVIFNDKIVGGNLSFYHNKDCVWWHGSFLSDYFRYGISNFLMHNIILDAAMRGYKHYDFNPSGGHEGAARFKEGFGAMKLQIKRWRWENLVIKKLRRIAKKAIS